MRVRAAVEELPHGLVDELGEMGVPEQIDVRQLLISYGRNGIPSARSREEALRPANELLAEINKAPRGSTRSPASITRLPWTSPMTGRCGAR